MGIVNSSCVNMDSSVTNYNLIGGISMGKKQVFYWDDVSPLELWAAIVMMGVAWIKTLSWLLGG